METCLTKKLVVQIYYQAENYKIRDHLTTIISYASFACLMHILRAYLFIICAFCDFFLISYLSWILFNQYLVICSEL